MNIEILLKLLALVAIANGAPILAKKIFKNWFNQPVDRGFRFIDGKPLFGPSKTYRGVIASLVATSIAAASLQLSLMTGFWFALFTMLGDLSSSFIKRRLNIDSSKRALGIDQVPEAIFPLLLLRSELRLEALEIVVIVAAFFLLELPVSRILYKLHIRQTPH